MPKYVDVRFTFVGPDTKAEEQAVALVEEAAINDIFEGAIDTMLETHENLCDVDILVVRTGDVPDEE